MRPSESPDSDGFLLFLQLFCEVYFWRFETTHKLTHTGKRPERAKEYRAGKSCPVWLLGNFLLSHLTADPRLGSVQKPDSQIQICSESHP